MSYATSKVVQYAAQKGWNFKTSDTQIQVETCPVCGDDGGHFYASYTPDKDGLWNCFKCGQSGNLYSLREFLGDRLNNVTSMKDVAQTYVKPEAVPNIEAFHKALLEEDESVENSAIDYLDGRGFSREVIEKYKLGVCTEFGRRWLVYPYLSKGKCVFVKYRTIPPDEKDFRSLKGLPVPLFNEDAITKDMPELILCEGEADCLSLLSNGVQYVVGVPGANAKKSAWIKMLDEADPKRMYILFDNDKVGQAAAKELANRIGIERVLNIYIPPEEGIKDINEWFKAGHTPAEFEELKSQAHPFDVEGILPANEVIEEIRSLIQDRGSLDPKWKASEWESFNRKLKGYEPGDLIGVLAPEKIGKTTWALNVLDFLNREYGESTLMFCQEMQPQRMVRKWISLVTGVEDGRITEDVLNSALNVAAVRDGDMLFGYTKQATRKDVLETIRQAVRRYGVKFVCFDNLQLICRSLDHAAQEISATTKEFKSLAMELGVVLFLIMQPHQMKEGEIVSARNTYGSSAPGKDVDAMICLHRSRVASISAADFADNPMLDVNESFSPEMLTRIDLSRYSAGGVVTLMFDGATSKVSEITPDMLGALAASRPPTTDPMTHVQPAQFVEA